VTPLQPQPYRLHVHDDVLDDLRDRLTRTRWPDEIPESGWQYGSSLAFMRRLTGRWRDGFDWRAQEAKLSPEGLHEFPITDRGKDFFREAWGWFAVVVVFSVLTPSSARSCSSAGCCFPECGGVFGRRAWLANGTPGGDHRALAAKRLRDRLRPRGRTRLRLRPRPPSLRPNGQSRQSSAVSGRLGEPSGCGQQKRPLRALAEASGEAGRRLSRHVGLSG
jgi:hypothetical protein